MFCLDTHAPCSCRLAHRLRARIECLCLGLLNRLVEQPVNDTAAKPSRMCSFSLRTTTNLSQRISCIAKYQVWSPELAKSILLRGGADGEGAPVALEFLNFPPINGYSTEVREVT